MTTDAPTLGGRLREARHARGLSAAAVARAVGSTGAYLRKIERGERRPSPGMLRLLASALSRSQAKRAQLLEELMALGEAAGQIAPERPVPRRRARRAAAARRDDELIRSLAIAAGDWEAAIAAADRTRMAIATMSW